MKRLAAIAFAAATLVGVGAANVGTASAAPSAGAVVSADNNGCIIILNWTAICIPRM